MAVFSNSTLLRVASLHKRYGNQPWALHDINFEVAKGEFFSIVGPSGCGKSTLLKILAGLESADSGQITLNGQDISALPAYQRPVNMMFQSYALFPHMTVENNIAFGLRRDKLPVEEIRSRVEEVLSLVQMQAYAKRKPDQLSGGQQQRVALARALAKRPQLLLLDEPLTALDKKLREHMRFELARIQQQVATTFIMVTHDQEEAMSLSSRIAVMGQGDILQMGTPQEIYQSPANQAVAEFFGDINLFTATLLSYREGIAELNCTSLGVNVEISSDSDITSATELTLALRPEHIHIGVSDKVDSINTKGVISQNAYLGNASLIEVELPSGMHLEVRCSHQTNFPQHTLSKGQTIDMHWRVQHMVLLTA